MSFILDFLHYFVHLGTSGSAVGERRSWGRGLVVRRSSFVGSVGEAIWIAESVVVETIGIRGVAIISIDRVLKFRII